MNFKPIDDAEIRPLAHFPEANRMVKARRGERLAVRTEREIVDAAKVAGKRVNWGPRVTIPNPYRRVSVATCRRDELAIWTKRRRDSLDVYAR
jgi:hypothetical protein